jgi:hypothetical protein
MPLASSSHTLTNSGAEKLVGPAGAITVQNAELLVYLRTRDDPCATGRIGHRSVSSNDSSLSDIDGEYTMHVHLICPASC